MKPTERFKQRYVSFRLALGGAAPAPELARSIVHGCFLSFFGELGISSLAFKLVKYDGKSGKGMVRCERGRVDEAVFCMACVRKWHGDECRLEPLSTGGTIKRA